jgi:Ca2+-binding RTX toxin-like protein
MKSRKAATNRPLQIESLENRKMMAANITAAWSNNVLTLNGSSQNDTIIVRSVNNKISVDGVQIPGGKVVNKIVVNGFGGDDIIRLDGNNVAGQAVNVPTLVFGGSGNDFIVGGNVRDELQGNAGNDKVYGLGGNDLLFGQDGNGLIAGGMGDDELQGGAGNDELLGEAGNDRLFGQAGNDWLWGGDGNDYVNGGSGLDVAYGNRGTDRFAEVSDASFFLVHPHLKSPIRRVGDVANYGVQDMNVS